MRIWFVNFRSAPFTVQLDTRFGFWCVFGIPAVAQGSSFLMDSWDTCCHAGLFHLGSGLGSVCQWHTCFHAGPFLLDSEVLGSVLQWGTSTCYQAGLFRLHSGLRSRIWLRFVRKIPAVSEDAMPPSLRRWSQRPSKKIDGSLLLRVFGISAGLLNVFFRSPPWILATYLFNSRQDRAF